MTLVAPRPNRLATDRLDGPMIHVPHVMDASIVDVLRWRRVPERRIAALLLDIDDSVGLADKEMRSLLPEGSEVDGMRHPIHFLVPIADGATWNGRDLVLRNGLPHSIADTLVGRRLRDIVDHPVLPDREIVSAIQGDEGLVVSVEYDLREVYHLSGADTRTILATDARIAARRSWIDHGSGAGPNARYPCDRTWFGFIEDRIAEGRRRYALTGGVGTPHLCWGERPITTPLAAYVTKPARWSVRTMAERLVGMFRRREPQAV